MAVTQAYRYVGNDAANFVDGLGLQHGGGSSSRRCPRGPILPPVVPVLPPDPIPPGPVGPGPHYTFPTEPQHPPDKPAPVNPGPGGVQRKDRGPIGSKPGTPLKTHGMYRCPAQGAHRYMYTGVPEPVNPKAPKGPRKWKKGYGPPSRSHFDDSCVVANVGRNFNKAERGTSHERVPSRGPWRTHPAFGRRMSRWFA